MVAQSFAVRGLMQSVLTPRSVARMAMSQTRCYHIPQMHPHPFHAASLFSTASSRAPFVARMSTGTRANLVEKVEEMTQKHKVVVFAKSWCPYCAEVNMLFKDLQVDAQVFNLDELADGDDVQDALMDVTGRRTVPQVFVGSKFLGGCDDTIAAYKSSELKKLFEEAGVEAKL